MIADTAAPLRPERAIRPAPAKPSRAASAASSMIRMAGRTRRARSSALPMPCTCM
jgi:hypothetical protein